MPQKTKTEFAAFTQASVDAESRTSAAMQKNPSISREKRKKEAEEPLYIYRM